MLVDGNAVLISIIVPVYNAEKYLQNCVDSILNQTFGDVEIILVDDGSIDGSSLLCDSFAQQDCRVKVFHQSNQGVSSARNKGIDNAVGQYVTFVDADDIVDNNVCAIFAEALMANDYDLFCYSAFYHKRNESVKTLLFGHDVPLLSDKQKDELHCKMMTPNAPDFEYKCNTRFSGSSCGKFYKRALLNEHNLRFSSKTVISEDVLFNVVIMDYVEKVGYSTKAFYHYQQQNDSAQNRYRPNSMSYFQIVIDEIQRQREMKKRSKLYIDCSNTLFVHYLFGSLKEDYFHKKNPRKDLSCSKLRNILEEDNVARILSDISRIYFSKSELLLVYLLKRKKVRLAQGLMFFYCLIG